MSSETGFHLGYTSDGIIQYDANEYYAIHCTWWVEDKMNPHSSYIGHCFVSIDGQVIISGDNYGGTYYFGDIIWEFN